MRDKESIREEFSPLIDDELDVETRATVEEELSASAEMLRELDQFKKVSDLYSQLPSVNAPEDFEARLNQRLEPDVVPLLQRNAVRTWIPALAAASVVCVAGGFWWLNGGADTGGQFQTAKNAEAPAEIFESDAPAAPIPAATPIDSPAPIKDDTNKQAMRADTLERQTLGRAMAADESADMSAEKKESAESFDDAAGMRAEESIAFTESLPTPPPTPEPASVEPSTTAQGDKDLAVASEAPSLAAPRPDIASAQPAPPPPAPKPMAKARTATALRSPAPARPNDDQASAEGIERVETRDTHPYLGILDVEGRFHLVDKVWTHEDYNGEALSDLPESEASRIQNRFIRTSAAVHEWYPVIYQRDGKWHFYEFGRNSDG